MDTYLFISNVNEGTSPGSARSNSSSIALKLFTKVSSRNRTKALTLREGTFFLGGGGLGPQRVGSSVKVSTKGGGLYPLFQLFKGRVTPFPEFLMGIFVMLFSIFL